MLQCIMETHFIIKKLRQIKFYFLLLTTIKFYGVEKNNTGIQSKPIFKIDKNQNLKNIGIHNDSKNITKGKKETILIKNIKNNSLIASVPETPVQVLNTNLIVQQVQPMIQYPIQAPVQVLNTNLIVQQVQPMIQYPIQEIVRVPNTKLYPIKPPVQQLAEAHQQINGKFNISLYDKIFNWSTFEQLKINQNEELNAISYIIKNQFIIPFFNELHKKIPRTTDIENNIKLLISKWNTQDPLMKQNALNELSNLCFLLDQIITDFNNYKSFELKVLMSEIFHPECLMYFLSFDNQIFSINNVSMKTFNSFSDMMNYFFNDQLPAQECEDSSDDEIITHQKHIQKPKDKQDLKNKFLKRILLTFSKIMNKYEHFFLKYLSEKININPQNHNQNLINSVLKSLYNNNLIHIEEIKKDIDLSIYTTYTEIINVNTAIKNMLKNKNEKDLFLFTSNFRHKYIVYKYKENGKEIIVKEFFRDNLTCRNINQFIDKYCGLVAFDIYNFKQKFREANWDNINIFITEKITDVTHAKSPSATECTQYLTKLKQYNQQIEDFTKDFANKKTSSLEKKQTKKEIVNFLLNLYVFDGKNHDYGLNTWFDDTTLPIICREFNQLKKEYNPRILQILTQQNSNENEVVHHPNGLINYNILPTHLIKSLITYI